MAEGVGTLKSLEGCRCISSIAENFGYYDPINVESAQTGFQDQKISPRDGVGAQPYEFHVEPTSDTALCMHNIYLNVKARIVRENGDNLEANEEVALVSNAISSMWKSIETKINNHTITPSSSYNIAYKSMMECLLSIDPSSNNSFSTGGFVMDSIKRFDTCDNSNLGFKRRKERVKLSKVFDLCGPVCSDFLKADNFLAPGHRLSLKFTRSSDEFVIMSGTDHKYRLEVKDIALHVRRVKLNHEIIGKIIDPAKPQQYLGPCTELKQYALPTGVKRWTQKLYTGQNLPLHLTIGTTTTAASCGSLALNPFHFQNFGLCKINLRINGQSYPNEPFTPDFSNDHFMRELLAVYQNTGKYRVDSGNCIDRDYFKHGCFLMPFDLSHDQCLNFHRHRSPSGVIELEMEWTEALTEGITVHVYASSDQVLLLGGDALQPQISVI